MPTVYHLYVKTHKKTGLKYLGQTKRDPFQYSGSGHRWTKHINIHGEEIDTQILQKCYTKSALKEWGLYYSKLWSVVESKQWANLRPEEGTGGATFGMKEKHHTNEAKKRISNSNLGKIRTPETKTLMSTNHVGHTGKKHSITTKNKISATHAGKPKTKNHKEKLSFNSKLKKPIHTPAGSFDSLTDAAKKLELCRDTIRNRIQNQVTGYYYL